MQIKNQHSSNPYSYFLIFATLIIFLSLNFPAVAGNNQNSNAGVNQSANSNQSAGDNSSAHAEPRSFQAVTAAAAVDFDSTQSQSSIARKMILFEMPNEYQCPVFSDASFVETVTALDKMQSQLNQVFPQCENKAVNDDLTQKASQLRQNLLETQKYQKMNESYRLQLSSQKMVQAAQQLQNALAQAAKVQTKVCYRSQQQFRNVLFSINDTFQSLAPVVVDLMSQNPELAATLGPAVSIFSGAEGFSQGLSLVEQIAKDSIIFNMEDQENRINTIKNVCQYMKLYRRLEYLRLSKLGQIQSIFADYQTEISTLQDRMMKASVRSDRSLFQPMQSGIERKASSDPTYDLFVAIKADLNAAINQMDQTQDRMEYLKTLNHPEKAQCQLISTVIHGGKISQVLSQLSQFNDQDQRDEAFIQIDEQLQAYQKTLHKMTSAKDLSVVDEQACVGFGIDWLKLAAEELILGQKLISNYQGRVDSVNQGSSTLAEIKQKRREEEYQKKTKNLEQVKTLLQYTSLESSEIEKRTKGMYKYFFTGPNFSDIKVVCDSQADSNCQSIGFFKALYQSQRNKGPVYELFLNNDLHFDYAYTELVRALSQLASFEYQQTRKDLEGSALNQMTGARAYEVLQNTYRSNYAALSHYNLKSIVKKSAQHQQICLASRQVLDKYLVASTHLMGSQALCDMIKPVLKEEGVDDALKKYCLPQTATLFESEQPSKLQSNIFKLIGADRSRFVMSPKSIVDKLIEKYDHLECE